jgi:hypothetical protein
MTKPVKVVLNDDSLSDLAEKKHQCEKIANHWTLTRVANKRDHGTLKNEILLNFMFFFKEFYFRIPTLE